MRPPAQSECVFRQQRHVQQFCTQQQICSEQCSQSSSCVRMHAAAVNIRPRRDSTTSKGNALPVLQHTHVTGILRSKLRCQA